MTREVPIDAETGLPALILPDSSQNPHEVNYHHHFFNRRHPQLTGELGSVVDIVTKDLTLDQLAGVAVRMSRGQPLPVDVHVAFHQQYGNIGKRLPTTLDEKFKVAVKGCAGVASRWAIDLARPSSDQLVYMDDDTYNRVASPDKLCPEDNYYDLNKDVRRSILADFFVRYALRHELTMVSGLVVDEFLHTRHERRRRELGNFILAEALDATVDPIAAEHNQLKRQGLSGGVRSMQTMVRKRVSALGTERHYPTLEETLLAAA